MNQGWLPQLIRFGLIKRSGWFDPVISFKKQLSDFPYCFMHVKGVINLTINGKTLNMEKFERKITSNSNDLKMFILILNGIYQCVG